MFTRTQKSPLVGYRDSLGRPQMINSTLIAGIFTTGSGVSELKKDQDDNVQALDNKYQVRVVEGVMDTKGLETNALTMNIHGVIAVDKQARGRSHKTFNKVLRILNSAKDTKERREAKAKREAEAEAA